ncbi:OLC1v1010446C1 [Oldenlandia corymbosa var. corymbosa]|uniref:OLC1v1010446C1 n=1 Tax=Oldenlandia corymbosa var. corymbosa TaxID=529605 RepID=A0AAV1DRC3_OLDCO|nr:OLC1v1010446C1 [Oldenlandia corymbosa var. corymbosa]
MEEFPGELRTPPVALVALVGFPELHAPITAHLHAEQPPINALALPDISKISVFARTPKDNSVPVRPVPGILKRDWVSKHRTRIPAVVAALFSSDHVSGDPAQWLQVCNDMDNLKAVTKPRNIKLVVAVVTQSSSKDEISEDRMLALRKKAEIDAKYVHVFTTNDPLELEQSLNRLRSSLAELANAYYRDEGRRIKSRLERKNLNSIELHIRCCFKVAVYAEFRRDWAEGLKFYEEAYLSAREMVGSSTRLPPIQRLVEIKTVAEQLHFKISTLLMHGGKLAEAIMWFRRHIDTYKKLVGAADASFAHWEWLSRQYIVFAELLETSSAVLSDVASATSGIAEKLTELEFYSAYYYQAAAQYLKEKSSCLELALSLSEHADETDDNDQSVSSVYVGQFVRLVELGEAVVMQPLTDEEFIRYALAEAKRFQASFEIVALLKKSSESYNNHHMLRMASYCGFKMAREYFTAEKFGDAKQSFDIVADLYRREGWVALLWEVLGYLRECSKRIGSLKDFIEHSLEMAALPVSDANGIQSFMDCGPAGPLGLLARETIHKEVFGLVRGEQDILLNEENNPLKVTDDTPLFLEIDLVSPLRVVLLASVAFHEQVVKPGTPTMLTVSLLTQLPLDVEIDQLEIQFNQTEYNFIIVNSQRSHLAAISKVQPGRRVEMAPVLKVATNRWLRLTYEIISEQSGKLECMYVIARIGRHFTISCRAESPASMNDLPLWKFEDRVESTPIKDPGLASSGQKAIQVEEPDPQVDLKLDSSGPALVGENFVVPVTITSKGHSVHSGELKINLVDTKGGGLLSPRDVEPFSTDNLHVELVGVSDRESADQSDIGSENIRKIQPSFGLISVPIIEEGKTWSCKLEIRWNRPKPVMLFVSLGYSPYGRETSSQKVHVHKNLQIEGKTALTISHQFMLPFRQDPLLPSTGKAAAGSDTTPVLPSKETSILLVSAKNCTEVPLRLLSMSIESEADNKCTVRQKMEEPMEPALVVPGEEFKKIFSVIPEETIGNMNIGTVCLRWRRDCVRGKSVSSSSVTDVCTKQRLPDVTVEPPPLILHIVCPAHATLGVPFTYAIKIQNRTSLLQEIKYSLVDSQSFVLSGPHNDTIFILPKSEHVASFKVVALVSGSQQMPRVTVTSTRYSATFQPSPAASTVFVFPSKPHFEQNGTGDRKLQSLAVE